MKTNYILVFLAAFVAILSVSLASAVNSVDDGNNVVFKSVEVAGNDAYNYGWFTDTKTALEAGNSLSVNVNFYAIKSVDDAKIRAWLSASGKDVTYISGRFDIIADSTYPKSFSLVLPSDVDLSKDVTLHIVIQTDNGDDEITLTLNVQRESYNVEVLDVNVDQTVSAGSTIPVSVVLKNMGRHELEDVFITAKIDALGISKRVYASDITPQDNWEDDEETEDSVERTLFITIPEDAKSGVYTLEVTASSSDADASVSRSLVVSGEVASSDVLTTTVSKTVAKGEEAVYDLVIVNSGSKMQLYTISAEAPTGLTVSINEPLVSVPADSTRVVKVSAEAAKSGTYSFTVDVSANGNLVKKVSLGTNVEGGKVAGTNATVVLTVVLAVIFVVLVIVLIILLTRRPTKTEELGESYY